MRLTRKSNFNVAIATDHCLNPADFKRMDQLRFQASGNAQAVRKSHVNKIIEMLNGRPRFKGRCAPTGSWLRKTNTKKPELSDVDIIVFIHSDKFGKPVDDLARFDQIRFAASMAVRDFIKVEGPKHYAVFEVKDKEFKAGYVLKVALKEDAAFHHYWHIDMTFAFDFASKEQDLAYIQNEFARFGGTPNAKRQHTASLARLRDELFAALHNKYPRLKPVIRFLKHWNKAWVVKFQPAEAVTPVYSIVFECLVLFLAAMGVYPSNFEEPRVLATCLVILADPGKAPTMYLDKACLSSLRVLCPPAPDQRQLLESEKRAGPNRLVIVDPMAPGFSNLAHVSKTKPKSETLANGWQMVTKAAGELLTSLKNKGVRPYPVPKKTPAAAGPEE